MKFYVLGSLFVVFFLFIIFLFNLFFYKKYLEKKKISSLLLLLLRSITLFILLILFIEPLFLYIKTEPQINNLNIYVDNSKSMNSGIDRDSLKQYINSIVEWADDQNYSSRIFIFGNSLQETGYYDFSENKTNYNSLIEDLNNKSNDLNIIFTDGNSTHGYNLSDIEFNLPINIVGVGDSQEENVKIKNINFESFINRGDSLEIFVEIESILDIDLDKYLSVWNNESLLSNKKIKLIKGKNIYREKILISTDNLDEETILDITLGSNSLKNSDTLNDYYKTKVFILSSLNEILLLTGSLNPNTQIIKNILSNIPNSTVSHFYKTTSNWNLPDEQLNIGSKNLIVYDNFPISKFDYALFDQIEAARNNESKILYFEGPSYDFNTINKIKLSNKKISTNQESIKNNFSSNRIEIKNLPPIRRNIIVRNKGFDKVHLEYSDSTVSIAQIEKSMYFFIPELSYLMMSEDSESFNEYIKDIIHLFMDSGKNLLVNSNKREILEGEKLILYSSYLDVYDTLKNSLFIRNINSGEENNISINKLKVDAFNNRYIDELNVDSYELYLKMSSNLDEYESNKLRIDVLENNLENKVRFRNEKEMKLIASRTNGNYYPLESIGNIKSLIRNYENIIQKKVELNIHSFHKFWFILLITLIIEWFFRKRKGLL